MPYTPMELANAFIKTGELDDAIIALQEHLEQNQADDEARRLYIQVQMRLSRGDDLANLIYEFDSLGDKTSDDWQLQSVIHERLDTLPLAIDAIRQALDLIPDDERLTERYLDLLLKNHDYEVALNLVRGQAKSWRWLEREGDILVLLGNDILATARYGLVLAHLDALMDSVHDDYLQSLKARVILARAHAYRRLEHTDIAEALYLEARAIVGDDVTIAFNLGLLAYMNGDMNEAIEQCKAALAAASATLRDHMLRSLDEDAQFITLKQQLTVQ
ncbi:MAG: tetratricopeptide repeat protein [Phototrophicaceae bacterium]